MNPPPRFIVRVEFQKLGKVRFISHRDMARIWERAVRMASLPIAYSEGFSPRARLSFGLALPTCFESLAEYVDLTLVSPVDASTLPGLLTPCLPQGVEVTGAVDVGKVDSLQQAVVATTWLLEVSEDPAAVESWIEQVLSASSIMLTRERKGKERTDDVRDAVLSLACTPTETGTGTEIRAELATQPRALRPNELLELLDGDFSLVVGRRLNQLIASDGARVDVMSAGAAATPHRELCAS